MKLLLVTILVLCVAAFTFADDGSDEGESKEEQFHCRNLSHDARLEKFCTIINDYLGKLEHALKSALEEKRPWTRDQTSDLNELESRVGDATMKKMVKIRDFLNKLNFNAGFPGLQENFRVFGIPISKFWALSILLDPFEI